MNTNVLAAYQDPRPNKYDDDLENRLVNFMHARHVPGSEAVHLNVRSGTVIVRGPLRSARAKWLCIECCRHVAGVIKLVDELVVELPRNRPGLLGTQPFSSTKTRINSAFRRREVR